MAISVITSPGLMGDVLDRYNTVGLFKELRSEICESCDADECDDCAGFAVLGHLENQIGEAGVDFMKQLVREWRESSVYV